MTEIRVCVVHYTRSRPAANGFTPKTFRRKLHYTFRQRITSSTREYLKAFNEFFKRSDQSRDPSFQNSLWQHLGYDSDTQFLPSQK